MILYYYYYFFYCSKFATEILNWRTLFWMEARHRVSKFAILVIPRQLTNWLCNSYGEFQLHLVILITFLLYLIVICVAFPTEINCWNTGIHCTGSPVKKRVWWEGKIFWDRFSCSVFGLVLVILDQQFGDITNIRVFSLIILWESQIADVWSCGVTLYVMLVGAYPFEDPEDPRNFRKTLQVYVYPCVTCTVFVFPVAYAFRCCRLTILIWHWLVAEDS